jgi:UDP-N-acetylmuramate dehydrogenase
LVDCDSEQELIQAVAEADAAGAAAAPGEGDARLLVLGGGSNLAPAEDLADLTVVRCRRAAVSAEVEQGRIRVTAQAGASWDHLVRWAVAHGWAALAPLSGIPGSVGALPVQNVGAYGAAASDLVDSVRAYDRAEGRMVELDRAQLGFGYRDSVLKRSVAEFGGVTPRWVVLDVTLDLGSAADHSVAVAHEQLAAVLDVEVGRPVAGQTVREAVLEVRRSKGMVLDPADRDTWSAGSYFTNPVIGRAQAASLPAAAPRFEVAGQVKTSAAWLMTHAGVERGRGLTPDARVTTSHKHVLALTNRGGATQADVLALESWIVDRVRDRFGVTLTREPVLIPGRRLSSGRASGRRRQPAPDAVQQPPLQRS